MDLWIVPDHMCFKQAQPKICHSPKVDNGVENKLFTPWTLFFGIFF